MKKYSKDAHRYMLPATWAFVAGAIPLIVDLWLNLLKRLNKSDVFGINPLLGKGSFLFMGITIVFFIVSLVLYITLSDEKWIEHFVKKRLFDPRHGNPLKFKEGELLPAVKCRKIDKAPFALSIEAATCTVEDLLNLAPVISSSINGRYKQYAVTRSEADTAFNQVTYQIEDVLEDKSLTANSVEELKSYDKTKIPIDRETYIDLTTSGSILVAGKTRSGKTTGIIAMLSSVLQHGRDEFLSNVMIIDPKGAELSRLPYVITLGSYGRAENILYQMKEFEKTVRYRQEALNKRSERTGDAVKWWDIGMNPSFLFIDEYVALKSLFPTRASKGDEYNLANFEGLLKRIVTMGASAGCFVIISIAEASVEEAGLPSMLKSAMTTKILFKPTVEEARLIWNSERLKALNAGRIYGAGDCWLSSTDGVHDMPGYFRFPDMRFETYSELGKLLVKYYAPKE